MTKRSRKREEDRRHRGALRARGRSTVLQPVGHDPPSMTARVEMLEVPAAGELHELAGIAGLAGALRVAAGELERHGVVCVAVDEELRHAERKPLDRRRDVVAA